MQTIQRRVTETRALPREAGAVPDPAPCGLLVHGAILESRDAVERKADESPHQPPRVVTGHRPAA